MRFDPAPKPLSGTVTPPADKSISHRAAIFAAMSEGRSVISNYLHAEDTTSTLKAMAQLGAKVDVKPDGTVEIIGVGLNADSKSGGPREPDGVIDVGNAGTLMRLLPGWLAGQEGRSYTFDGDDSIRRRPVDRIAEPLRQMGGVIEATDGRFPPFTVHGAKLHGIEYRLPVASAQVKSCVLLAGLMAKDITVVAEPVQSRNHTEKMLYLLCRPDADVEKDMVERAQKSWKGGTTEGPKTVVTRRRESFNLGNYTVLADFSSAAFMVAAALVVPDSQITLTGVNNNWTRTGFLRIIEMMGAEFQVELEKTGTPAVRYEEKVFDLSITSSALKGIHVPEHEVPLAIDELPLVALLGCFAEGETKVTGASELRVKESDRIEAVVTQLSGLGAQIEALPDGFVVQGTGGIRGGVLDSGGDHRMAMLGAVAGLASTEGVEVKNFEAAAVSYPGFSDDLKKLLNS